MLTNIWTCVLGAPKKISASALPLRKVTWSFLSSILSPVNGIISNISLMLWLWYCRWKHSVNSELLYKISSGSGDPRWWQWSCVQWWWRWLWLKFNQVAVMFSVNMRANHTSARTFLTLSIEKCPVRYRSMRQSLPLKPDKIIQITILKFTKDQYIFSWKIKLKN